MKASFAIAAGLLLVVSPVLAKPHHRAKIRRESADRGSVVTAGSSIRITSTGEVIGPGTPIVVISPALPDPNRGRPPAKQP